LYGQLLWAANALNEGYYAWRTGDLKAYNHYDGRIEHPDPWQNAVTVSIQNYFSIIYISKNDYEQAISPEGLAKTYQELFGDPWKDEKPHIPGSLAQPDFSLPFENGKSWTYTGGPHTGWGSGKPYAAIDFAPPAAVSGCIPSEEWVTAIADGLITRTDTGVAMLDVDGDGDERTGWVILYLHLAGQDMVKPGTRVSKGDVIGHPSCEGGHSTGTHVHIARRYNGEWMVADGAIPFTLEGWVVENGSSAYEGRLVRGGLFIRACVCSDKASQITAGSQ
jgi:murein DD-endopeptidase MepM/ murein hydrolase activator NlpD